MCSCMTDNCIVLTRMKLPTQRKQERKQKFSQKTSLHRLQLFSYKFIGISWFYISAIGTLQWRHNGLDGVSNHQPHHCLLSCLFGRRSKKTSKLHVTGLCAGNSPGTGEFPIQRASNVENVSIWWRHHETLWWLKCSLGSEVLVTTLISSIPLFSLFFTIVKTLITNWISHQSCCDTCQIWISSKETNRYFLQNKKKFLHGKINEAYVPSTGGMFTEWLVTYMHQ